MYITYLTEHIYARATEPIFPYENKTYESGILFDEISQIKLSLNTYETGFQFDISEFLNRIGKFSTGKIAIGTHCQNKTYHSGCKYLNQIIDSFILYGQKTIEFLDSQGKTDESITKMYKEMNTMTKTFPNNTTTPIHDKKLAQIMDDLKYLMEEQVKDSKTYYELFNGLKIETARNYFPLDTTRKLVQDVLEHTKDDEELFENITLDKPHNIFSIANIQTNYNNRILTLKMIIPIFKKENYILYKSLAAPVLVNEYILEIPSDPFFLINTRGTKYIPIGKNKIDKCATYVDKNIRICNLDRYTLTTTIESCQTLLLKNATNLRISQICYWKRLNKFNHIISERHANIHHCIIHQPIQIKIQCDDKFFNKTLKHSGQLELKPTCSVLHNKTTPNTIYSNVTKLIEPQFKLTKVKIHPMNIDTDYEVDNIDDQDMEKILKTGRNDHEENAFVQLNNALNSVYNMTAKLVKSEYIENKTDKITTANITITIFNTTETISNAEQTVDDQIENIIRELLDYSDIIYENSKYIFKKIIGFFYTVFYYLCGLVMAVIAIKCIINTGTYAKRI